VDHLDTQVEPSSQFAAINMTKPRAVGDDQRRVSDVRLEPSMSGKSRQLNGSRLLVAVLGLSIAFPAHAYIDPVTGSFVVQGLVAGVMAAIGGVRSIRQRIIRLFRRRRDQV